MLPKAATVFPDVPGDHNGEIIRLWNGQLLKRLWCIKLLRTLDYLFGVWGISNSCFSGVCFASRCLVFGSHTAQQLTKFVRKYGSTADQVCEKAWSNS